MRATLAAALALALTGCTGVASFPPASSVITMQDVAAPNRVLSVCEIFAALPWYNGKTVTVRGLFHNGLRQLDCPKRNLVFPAFDVINYPDELARAERTLKRGQELWGTVEGRVNCDPEMPFGGYGHLGAYAAELVVGRIVRIEIQKNPQVNYSLGKPARAA